MRPLPGQRRPTRLADVVHDVLAAVAPERRREIAFEPGEDVEAEVDGWAVRTILTNLVENALLYGEPPVVVSTAPWRDETATLVVEDRGRGVAPQFVPELFSAFSRSEQSKLEGGGAGLGLAISSLLARLNGGQLLYEPVEPHGARFRLVLPTPGLAGEARQVARSEPAADQPLVAARALLRRPGLVLAIG